MSTVSPYSETETFARGPRVLLVPLAGALLVGPYNLLLRDTSDLGVVAWGLTAVAVALGAVLAGIGIAQPRRRITADGDTREFVILRTAPAPRIGSDRHVVPFGAVTGVDLRDAGPRGAGRWTQPVLELDGGGQLGLKPQPSWEHAQDVVDHLVLLGLPGESRAARREADLSAPKPATWL